LRYFALETRTAMRDANPVKYIAMKPYLFLLLLPFLIDSCNSNHPHLKGAAMKAHMDSLKAELLRVDVAFSKLSEEKGRNAAFLAYLDSNATMLRANSMPVSGWDSINQMLNRHPDSGYVLTWVPIKAHVAHSGDMGYTYGTYSLTIKDKGKEAGTYCTIWKKRKGRNWKVVLDTGNEGLGD
jgi:ketosteroid isomerase-like protein